MAKGFGSNSYRVESTQYKQQQIFENLKCRRDQLLGLAWLGYLKHGVGAIHFTITENGEAIDYIQRNQIADFEVCQVVDSNDPTLAAVILYGGVEKCTIVTLSGPKKPPECYSELSDELK